MILITVMKCSNETTIDRVEHVCSNISQYADFCISIPLIKAPWHNYVIAFLHTINAFKRGKNVAKKPSLEFLIRFFGERQIAHILNDLIPKYSVKNYYVIIVLVKDQHKEKTLMIINEILDVLQCQYTEFTHILSPEYTTIENVVIEKLGIEIKEYKSLSEEIKNALAIAISGCSDIIIE